MKWIPLTLAWLTLAATVNVAAPALKDRKDDHRTRILGNWTQVSISQRGGQPEPGAVTTFRFGSDGKCGITNTSRENPAQYTLNVAATPRRMKWLNGPELTEWLCLYELDGDTLKVAFVDQGTEAPRKSNRQRI